MTLPASPNTTYVAGSTPAIKADDLNAMQALLVSHDAAIIANAIVASLAFGTGTDGDATLDGTNWPSFMAGGIMTRDVFFNNLTLTALSLQTRGFRIYCRGTFRVTNSSAFVEPTTDTLGVADKQAGNTGFPGQTVAGQGGAGGAGGTGAAGNPGSPISNSYGNHGGLGGGSASFGGGGQGLITSPVDARGLTIPWNAATFGSLVGGGQIALINGGAGGGGGGATGGLGMGGGVGGAVLAIAARNVNLANASNLRARGGNGNFATTGGGGATIGGGGGGGGGCLLLAYQTLTLGGGTLNSNTCCLGGNGGAGFPAGSNNGGPGNPGRVILLPL